MAATDARSPQADFQLRSRSPSPDHQPSAALAPYPPDLDRSFSTASSTSIGSGASVGSDGVPRRRGYVRPQATVFSDSARNRDSVMSLGSIAHLQYYFARTGLLDGKGAQLAKEEQLKKARENRRASANMQQQQQQQNTLENMPQRLSSVPESAALLDDPFSTMSTDSVYRHHSSSQTHISSETRTLSTMPSFEIPPSPTGSPRLVHVDSGLDLPPEALLHMPPTMSTYKQKSTYVPPPPDLAVLRRELREALDDAKKLLRDLAADARERPPIEDSPVRGSNRELPAPEQWQELQGLQVLDLVTLAIRAAKNYYTSHEAPRRLYTIQPEREIRAELYQCLEVLKKLASRNFSGGVRTVEREAIGSWIASIEGLVNQDEAAEKLEHDRRRSWHWLVGEWTGRERQREYQFLQSFDEASEPLPPWTEPSTNMDPATATPFLKALQNGLRLCHLHNALLQQSRRQFETIKLHHRDTNLPYRCAENLRFWIKATELRWDTLLDVDVAAVVRGDSVEAWLQFDRAVLQWCGMVRRELTKEWNEHHEALQLEQPKMRVQVEDAAVPW